MEYGTSSRDYLKRARARLGDNEPSALIYAALELRCGVEARMTEYLDVQTHLSKKKKKSWQLAKLGRHVEAAFKIGDKIVRWAVHDKKSGELIACFYYTPVTSRLRKSAEKLGHYLHSMKQFKPFGDPYWRTLRDKLEDVTKQLELANKGTLLGPPLMKRGTGDIRMVLELPPEFDANEIMKKLYQEEIIVKVSYIQSFPGKLERESYVWSFSG